MGVFLFDAGVRPYAPAFVDGTTGGTGGTVSDGGAAGRLTFTLPTSGHSDLRDGCYIAWPARDVLGRRLPDLPAGLTDASDRLYDTLGPLRWKGVAAPTFGNGCVFFLGFALVQDLSDAMATTTWFYGGGWEFFVTGGEDYVQVLPIRYTDGAYETASQQGANDNQKGSVSTPGAWEAGNPNAATFDFTGDINRARRALWLGLTSDVAGAKRVIVAGGYRIGSSSGSESFTVDIEAALTRLEAL